MKFVTPPFRIWTDAIDDRGFFDPRYTCDIDNSSPELRWENSPQETAGFAIICETIEGSFVHWLVYHIPPSVHHVPAGIPPQDSLPNGIRQGLNSYRKLGYSGPCPPKNAPPQRYRIRLFALHILPDPPVRPDRDQLLNLIEPYIIQSIEIVGNYQRVMIERAG